MIRPEKPDLSTLCSQPLDLQEPPGKVTPLARWGRGDMTLSLIYYCICAGAGRLR